MKAAVNTSANSEFAPNLLVGLREEFEQRILAWQTTSENMPTIWVDRKDLTSILIYLRDKAEPRFEMLFDTLKLRPILIVNRAAKCHYSYSNQISKT